MNDNSPIIGDLVEEYREVVLPERGRVRATLWFVRQLASLVPAWTWGGTLLGAAFVGRNALDEFAPPADFHVRSTVTTFVLIGIVLGPQRGRRGDPAPSPVARAPACVPLQWPPLSAS